MTPDHLIRAEIDGERRLVRIPPPPRFSGLVKAIKEAYAIPDAGGFSCTYEDTDGDQVGEYLSLENLISMPLRDLVLDSRRALLPDLFLKRTDFLVDP